MPSGSWHLDPTFDRGSRDLLRALDRLTGVLVAHKVGPGERGGSWRRVLGSLGRRGTVEWNLDATERALNELRDYVAHSPELRGVVDAGALATMVDAASRLVILAAEAKDRDRATRVLVTATRDLATLYDIDPVRADPTVRRMAGVWQSVGGDGSRATTQALESALGLRQAKGAAQVAQRHELFRALAPPTRGVERGIG